jgi:hypothetical protein
VRSGCWATAYQDASPTSESVTFACLARFLLISEVSSHPPSPCSVLSVFPSASLALPPLHLHSLPSPPRLYFPSVLTFATAIIFSPPPATAPPPRPPFHFAFTSSSLPSPRSSPFFSPLLLFRPLYHFASHSSPSRSLSLPPTASPPFHPLPLFHRLPSLVIPLLLISPVSTC